MIDPYEVLKVEKTATAEDIKLSYRILSKEHHPDKGGDADKMAEIAEAYAILSDPVKKAEYDETGKVSGPVSFEQEVDAWTNRVLAQAVDDKDVNYQNLMSKAERIAKTEIQKINQLIETLERYRDSLIEIVEKKCAVNPDDSEPRKRRKEQFGYIVNKGLDQITDQIEKTAHQLDIAEAAKEQLKELESDDDERVWMPTQSYTIQSTATGW